MERIGHRRFKFFFEDYRGHRPLIPAETAAQLFPVQTDRKGFAVGAGRHGGNLSLRNRYIDLIQYKHVGKGPGDYLLIGGEKAEPLGKSFGKDARHAGAHVESLRPIRPGKSQRTDTILSAAAGDILIPYSRPAVKSGPTSNRAAFSHNYRS